MDKRYRVALLIESSRAYGRGLLAGIARYVREQGTWSVFHQERGMSDDAPSWFVDWTGDGIIARIESQRLLKHVRQRGIPAIDLRGMHDIDGIPLLETNDRRVTELAVQHLGDRGLRHLAFCGYSGANFSNRRRRYFEAIVPQAKQQDLVYEGGQRVGAGDTSSIEGQGLLYEVELGHWIESLPRPVGIMCCNDVRGQQVINACRDLDIGVPDEVAVIGVDNDELICELSDPPLSSVAPNTAQIGYAAAELLDAMIGGAAPPAAKIFTDPLGVVARRSTDAAAIADHQTAQAMRFIREHACDGIHVRDVVQHVALSRSTLERRFAALLNSSPKREIGRIQLERVKHLLRETSFTLDRIAELAGYRHLETMCAVFKRESATTPGEYRALHRGE